MGILDAITGGLKNLTSTSQGQPNVLDTIGSLINNPETGGLNGLVQTFREKGLGEVVSSWISTGQNLPVSADQIANVLNKTQLQQVAEKLGISAQDASSHIAEFLPKIIDKLTPDGTLPDSDDTVSKGLEMMKNKLFGD